MSKKNSPLAYMIFTLVALFLLYIMGLQVSPSVMAIAIMEDLKINSERLGLLSSFFFYSYTLMQIPSGLLFDRFSERWILSLACLLCGLGALFFGLTEGLVYACFGRFLMGIGSSFAFVGALVIAARWFSAGWFAKLAGATQFLAGAGALVGALPLAYVVRLYGWRETLVGLGIFGILLAALLFLLIRDRSKKQSDSNQQVGLTILQSLKILIAERQNIYGALYSFFTWGPVLVFAGLWGVPFFMVKYQMTNMQAAFFISWIWVGVALSSPLHGIISDFLKRRKIVLIISALMGVITSMILISGPDLSDTSLIAVLLVFGFACAAQILAFALIKENNRSSVIATGMGFNNMAVVLGGALLQPLVGWMMSRIEPTAHAVYSLESYTFALGIVPICFFCALIISLFFIKETYLNSGRDAIP